MLLIDSTIPPQKLDLECLDFLGENDIPVTIVFTKVTHHPRRQTQIPQPCYTRNPKP
jgi:GTP-binding protein